MKVSLNTLKRYTDIDVPVDKLVSSINEQLGGVEEVINLGIRYEGAVIVDVVSCEKHHNADKLNVCFVDDKGFIKDVERSSDGYVQVVCGAPNVRAGLRAVWLPPGSTVPASFDDSEPFVLGSRELRGVMSNGMLASPKELGLGDSHEGILELETDVKPGKSFSKIYGLDDHIIDIENKMFTHRPDCFGVIGVAREIAGIHHIPFTSPAFLQALPEFNSGDGLELRVKNDAYRNVPRFMAVTIKGVSVGPSPVWLQAELTRLGGKPINNVVDVTNYVMLLTGQPVHAYDYDKLRGRELGARMAKKGETVELLNSKTYQLDPSDVVIVDGDGPVGLGGVMGGGNSEVSSHTTSLVLECATFDMYTIRRTSMRHGLFTDAVTRFTKGQSPLQNDRVMTFLIETLAHVAGGAVASQMYDLHGTDLKPIKPVEVSASFVNDRLGLSLSAHEMAQLLTNVEFGVEVGRGKDALLKVTVPLWRTDIAIPEDIVEEVGRLYGYDRLPRVLPTRSTKPTAINSKLALKRRIRDSLRRSGANEVLTYSFVHEKLLNATGFDPKNAYKLSNALSPELQYYRPRVLPSLLEKVHPNIKSGHDEFVLFELGKGHDKRLPHNDENLPAEVEYIDAVYASKKPHEGAAFYMMRRTLDGLAKDLGIELGYVPYRSGDEDGMFEHSRSASVIDATRGVVIGTIGEFDASTVRALKLPAYSAGMSLNFEAVHGSGGQAARYRPLSRYPSLTQDLSLKVPSETAYKNVHDVVTAALSQAVTSMEYITTDLIANYQAKAAHTKTMTFRIRVTSDERTLSDADVTKLLDAVVEKSVSQLGAERV